MAIFIHNDYGGGSRDYDIYTVDKTDTKNISLSSSYYGMLENFYHPP